MLLKIVTQWATYDNCCITIEKYHADGSYRIGILSPFMEGPIATITTCIPDANLEPDTSCIDTNNCPWAERLIKEHNLGTFTGERVQSGFCWYPVVKWNVDELLKYTVENNS